MTVPCVEELECTAQQLHATTAQHLAFAVNQGDRALISDLLDPLNRQELLALCVVLADLVPMPLSRPDDGVFDEVAVQRAMDGDPVPLTTQERAAACRQMALRGDAVGHIARAFRMGVESVKAAIALQITSDGQQELFDDDAMPDVPRVPVVDLDALRAHYQERRSA